MRIFNELLPLKTDVLFSTGNILEQKSCFQSRVISWGVEFFTWNLAGFHLAPKL